MKLSKHKILNAYFDTPQGIKMKFSLNKIILFFNLGNYVHDLILQCRLKLEIILPSNYVNNTFELHPNFPSRKSYCQILKRSSLTLKSNKHKTAHHCKCLKQQKSCILTLSCLDLHASWEIALHALPTKTKLDLRKSRVKPKAQIWRSK